MKTFTLNIPKESWNWSYTLDIRTILCNRSWILFNDEHEKEVYIFQEAGTLIVSQNGKVNKTKWEYITQNASLIIENINSGTYMLKPTYYDKKVLVLQVYGTNEYVTMFNENNLDELMLNSIDKVKQYIEKQQENAGQTTKVSFTPHKNNQEDSEKLQAVFDRPAQGLGPGPFWMLVFQGQVGAFVGLLPGAGGAPAEDAAPIAGLGQLADAAFVPLGIQDAQGPFAPGDGLSCHQSFQGFTDSSL